MEDLSLRLIQILNEAKLLEAKEEYDLADTHLSQAISEARKNNHGIDSILASLLNFRGIVRRGKRDYNSAFEDYENVLNLPKASNFEKANAHINIADIYRVRDSDFKNAHVSLDEAVRLSVVKTFTHAKAIDQRGMVLYAQSFLEDNEDLKKEYLYAAHTSYQHARIIIADIVNNIETNETHTYEVQKLYANTTHRLGLLHSEIYPSEIGKACALEREALSIHEKIGNNQGAANALATLGVIARKKGTGEAIKQYNLALEKTRTPRAEASLYLSLAEAHASEGKFDDAVLYIDRFVEGVEKGVLTAHDLALSKKTFLSLFDAYANAPKAKDGINKLNQVYKVFL